MSAIAAAFLVLTFQLLLAKSSSPDCLQTPFVNGFCHNPPKLAWSYDLEKGRCRRFLYTGCSPSGNVFLAKGDCELVCDRFARVQTKLSAHQKFKRAAAAEAEASNGSTLGLAKLCFQRYNLVQLDQCQFSRVHAWYYERGSGSCQQYEVCVPEDVVYKNRHECMQSCVPLYKGILDMAMLQQQQVDTKAKEHTKYLKMEPASTARTAAREMRRQDFHEWLNREIERRMKNRPADYH